MANEFKHLSIGGELTQAEYEAVGGHVLESQAIGDIIYATSTSQLSRLGIGSTGAVLTVTGGVPAWDTTWTPTGHLIPAADDSYDLGSSAAAWQDLFLEGDISLTDAGSISTAAGALTIGSAAAINITPTAGSAILLDGTISIDAGVVTGATSITSTAFVGDITGDVTGNADTATLATTVTATANNSTDETVYPTFVDGVTSAQGIETDAGLTYNPSTGVLTSTTFTGNLTGNVTGNTSGTAATVTTPAQGNITSLGTLSTLTVDNVIVNGTTIGHTSDTDLLTLTSANLAVAGDLEVSGSVEVATIDYTDGDPAITIADGGGVTFAQSLTVTGATVLNGDVTLGNHIDDVITINGSIAGANAVIFEGATGGGDANETTLSVIDPTADHTIYMPNKSGYLGVFAAASTTQISSTPEELNLLDGVSGLVQADFTKLAAVDATAAELNLLDGDTSVGGSITLADADGFVVNDGGVMKTIPASDINTYVGDNDTTYTAGVGLALSGTTLSLDLSELSTVTPANGDFFSTLDSDGANEQKTSTTALATLFAGTGLTASNSVIGVDASQGQITTVGTIGVGVWEATDVGVAHGGTGASTAAAGFDALAPMTAAGDIIYGGASGTGTRLAKGSDADVLTLASGVPTWATPTTGDITNVIAGAGMTGGATSGEATLNVIGGTGITANADEIVITPAQTTITSIYATDLIIGEDAQTAIDFGTPDEIDFKINNTAELTLDASSLYPIADAGLDLGTATLGFNDLHLGSAGILNFDNANMTITHSDTVLTVAGGTFATAALTATTFAPTDDITLAADKSLNLANEGKVKFTDTTFGDGNQRSSGITLRFTTSSLAIAIGQAVHLSGTTVILADADVGSQGAIPCIGVAASATTGSGTENIDVLVLGCMRYDTYDFTAGSDVFVTATPGGLDETAPSTDGHYVQKVGIAISADILYVNPSLDVIEHA